MPGKLSFKSVNHVSDEVLATNRAYSHGLDLPEVGSRPVAARLAVVGGSPSVADYLDEIRDFDGEIWAINGAFGYLKAQGIDSTFYTIDPSERVARHPVGATRAVLADTVAPEVFDIIEHADIELAKIGADAIPHATTSAATAAMIAGFRGHKRVVYFGCDGSTTGDMFHAYSGGVDHGTRVVVVCGGQSYMTNPQMIMQTEFLAQLIRGMDGCLTVRGQGFLSALIKYGDYEVSHVSRDIDERLRA